jgi:hypothetical protein
LVPSAFGRANLAFAQANAAFAQANTGGSGADAYARDTANAGFITANSASVFANGAFDRANASYGVANSGSSFANSSFDRANAAYNAANTATDSWVRTQANNAYDKANSAGSFANGAFDRANASYASQNTTAGFANSAFAHANAAFASANIASGSNNTISIQTDKFVANGSTTTFNLSVTPLSEDFVTAVVEGAVQLRDTYTVSSNVIYFDSTFENGANIEVTILSGNSYLSVSSTDTYARGTANAAFAKANNNLTAATAQSGSGTAVDFTSIPSWVKRITLMFALVSTNGNSFPLVQLGNGGSATTSGYNSVGTALTASATGVSTSTAGFIIRNTGQSTSSMHGSVVFSNINGNRWVASGTFIDTQDSRTMWCVGQVDLGGTLDMLRVTTVNGSDSYDTGTINILYE